MINFTLILSKFKSYIFFVKIVMERKIFSQTCLGEFQDSMLYLFYGLPLPSTAFSPNKEQGLPF